MLPLAPGFILAPVFLCSLVILHEGNCLGSVRLHLKVAKGSVAEAEVLSALERGRLVKCERMVVELKGA